MTTAAAARQYLQSGFMPVPIPRGEKGPRMQNWQNFHAHEEDLDELFTGNIGLLLGTPSNGLVDIDLDSAEAVALAPAFLPPTEMIHGRPSKPRSHYWYRTSAPTRTKRFQNTSGTCLLELRGTGGQTVVPPSVHPSGEAIDWHQWGEPACVDHAALLFAAEKLAGATLCARHYPTQGTRQDYAMALAGMLAKGGWSLADTELFLKAIATVAGDEELEARCATAARTAKRVQRGDPTTGYQALTQSIGADDLKKLSVWLHLQGRGRPNPGANGTSAQAEKDTGRLSQLLMLAEQQELFHTPEDEAYITVVESRGPETFAIDSGQFDHWITAQARAHYNFFPREQIQKEIRHLLTALAKHEGPCHPVFRRVAGDGSKIVLDLADAQRRIVEITATGWTVTTRSTIKFIRPGGMLSLPCPQPLEDLNYFKEFFNTDSEDDFRLLLSWVLFSLNPVGPYPVLVLQGEAGSAKSTLASMLKRLIDPNAVPLRSFPRSEQDFVIGARSNHILAFDNLSGLSDWSSDVLCRVSTGAGFATRRLYTNSDEVRFQLRRPVILNGIDDIATRQDLIDRSLVINLPSMPAESRRDEVTLQKNFDAALPYLLGALLSKLVVGVEKSPATVLPKAPRMADFARWSTAVETSLGWAPGGFLTAYGSLQADALEIGIESSPVAESIKKLLGVMPQWSGTATELLVELSSAADESTRRSRIWPRTASQMGGEVRRFAPAFRAQGIEVEMTRDTDSIRTRRISFRRMQSESAQMPLSIPAVRPVRPVRPNKSVLPMPAVVPHPPKLVPPRDAPDAQDAPDGPVGEVRAPSSRPPTKRPWLNWLNRRL